MTKRNPIRWKKGILEGENKPVLYDVLVNDPQVAVIVWVDDNGRIMFYKEGRDRVPTPVLWDRLNTLHGAKGWATQHKDSVIKQIELEYGIPVTY